MKVLASFRFWSDLSKGEVGQIWSSTVGRTRDPEGREVTDRVGAALLTFPGKRKDREDGRVETVPGQTVHRSTLRRMFRGLKVP